MTQADDHFPQEDNMTNKSAPLQRETNEEESKRHYRAGINLAIPWTMAISAIGWCAYTIWNRQTDSDKVVVVHEIRLKSLEDSAVILRASITDGLNKADMKIDKVLDKLDELRRTK